MSSPDTNGGDTTGLPPVFDIQVDLASKRVTVGFTTDASKIRSAIEEAGYEVERLTA